MVSSIDGFCTIVTLDTSKLGAPYRTQMASDSPLQNLPVASENQATDMNNGTNSHVECNQNDVLLTKAACKGTPAVNTALLGESNVDKKTASQPVGKVEEMETD